MSQLRSAEDDAYRLLTEAHTFLVLDTETAPAAGGGPQRVIQVGTLTVRDGRLGRVRTRLIDPCEPITNSHIHGLTGADVHGKGDFSRHVDAIDVLLRDTPDQPPLVLVAQYANYDVDVLRGEYARIGRELPEVPVLDTISLSKYVGHDPGPSRSLTNLARSLNIQFKPEHDAGKDARATAKVLVALLRIGARAGLVDLAYLLEQIGSTATALPPPSLTDRPVEPIEAELSADHLATHNTVLPADPTPEDLETWVAGIRDCVRVRCPLARDRAAIALRTAAEASRTLLEAVAAPATTTDAEPGQAGTYAGILAELIPAARAQRAGAVMAWWRENRDLLRSLPRCDSDGRDRCPDCRDGQPCPLGTLHQVVAAAECGFTHDGHIPSPVLNRLVQDAGGTIWTWSDRGETDVAGYAAWLVIDYLERTSALTRGTGVLDRSVQLGLDQVEPRLALAHAEALLGRDEFNDVRPVLDACSRPAGSTDPGYRMLTDWAAGPYTEALARLKLARPRVRTLPRQSRPEGRIRPNRFKR